LSLGLVLKAVAQQSGSQRLVDQVRHERSAGPEHVERIRLVSGDR
jgi:hypothetical protein